MKHSFKVGDRLECVDPYSPGVLDGHLVKNGIYVLVSFKGSGNFTVTGPGYPAGIHWSHDRFKLAKFNPVTRVTFT